MPPSDAPILILLGPPGAGKGTQAPRLCRDRDLRHIATGDLLRAHRARATPLGRQAAPYMAEGRLVPDGLVIAMIVDEVDGNCGGGFLLDGFPRTLAQADALDQALDARPLAALLIDVPDDTVLERIGGRRQCPNGHVYHVALDPPVRDGVCDEDGTALTRRDDDRPDTVRRRLRTYHEATAPLVDHYARRGLLRRVDGTRDPDDVYDQLCAAIATAHHEER